MAASSKEYSISVSVHIKNFNLVCDRKSIICFISLILNFLIFSPLGVSIVFFFFSFLDEVLFGVLLGIIVLLNNFKKGWVIKHDYKRYDNWRNNKNKC